MSDEWGQHYGVKGVPLLGCSHRFLYKVVRPAVGDFVWCQSCKDYREVGEGKPVPTTVKVSGIERPVGTTDRYLNCPMCGSRLVFRFVTQFRQAMYSHVIKVHGRGLLEGLKEKVNAVFDEAGISYARKTHRAKPWHSKGFNDR